MNRILLLFFVLNSFLSISQTQSVKGKVLSDGMVGDILVINLSQETETKTDALGQFIIEAKSGDLLIFSAEFIHKKRYLVEEIDFSKLLEIFVEAKSIKMETVELNFYNDIDAVSLGILQQAPKKYTTAERRVYTASGTVGFDLLINAITGKTKRLKYLVEMEREDKRVEYLSSLFNDEFFIQTLLIPKDKLTEFKYYAAYTLKEQLPHHKESTNKPSKDKLEVELIPLAKNYLELQNDIEK